MTGRPPTTLEQLKQHLVDLGRDPDGVAYAGDRQAPQVDGMNLLRARPDGTVEVTAWERGVESNSRVYPTEAAAVQAVASSYATPAPTGRVRSTEERRADGARMQDRAQEMLRRIEAAQDGKQRRGE